MKTKIPPRYTMRIPEHLREPLERARQAYSGHIGDHVALQSVLTAVLQQGLIALGYLEVKK